MKIVAGLGNPGPKYETTRHNAGFLAVDRLADAWGARGPNKEGETEVFQATVAGEKVILVKPLTYMNNSGRSIGPLYKFFKCTPDDLIVIHDELDLKPLTFRLKSGGGAGGHNGLKSIDQHLGAGSTGYHRIRIGVGKPGMVIGPEDAKINPLISTVDYVLQPFTDDELNRLDRLLDDVVQAAELLIRGESKQAMNQFNREKTY